MIIGLSPFSYQVKEEALSSWFKMRSKLITASTKGERMLAPLYLHRNYGELHEIEVQSYE